MNKTLTAIIILAIIIIAGIFIYRGARKSNSANNAIISGNNSSAPIKLSDEPYAQYAYEVNPNNLSADAQTALSGFNVSQQSLTNGDTKITLTATNSKYATQNYELKPGQKLYFIEKTLGDDHGSQDSNLGDDTAVIVDQNGYVVQ